MSAAPHAARPGPRKIGIMGGSFDPVHFGHLVVAQDAFEKVSLDRLIFTPAAQAPLKSNMVQCSAEDRLAMLRAAIAPDARFEVSDHELRKGGVSYTIDSARHFQKQFPGDRIFWIIGADQLPRLHLWKDIGELVKIVEFICLGRPGYSEKTSAEIPDLRLHCHTGHLLEISSTELRERIAKNLPLDYFMPRKAIELIQQKSLYRQRESGT